MKISRVIDNDSGSILLEAVSFAAMAFGLLLTLGLNILDLERRQLGIEQVARNAIRYYLLSPNSDLSEAVFTFQSLDVQFDDDQVGVLIDCSPSDCDASGSLVWLELKAGANSSRAFGVVP
ncbi:MAG: hypothetical protein WCG32_04595 [Actinomycetes bacterium]